MEFKWTYKSGWLIGPKLETSIKTPLTKKKLDISIRTSGDDRFWSIVDKNFKFLGSGIAPTISIAEQEILEKLKELMKEDKQQWDEQQDDESVNKRMESEAMDFLNGKGTPEGFFSKWWRKRVGRHL